tara:strand:- start:648 stop:1550 length:903 start_codon:yes stop_codon:yes gene_type:complete
MMIFDNRIRILQEVAKAASFTEAAKKLGISGAAVSRQIKSLEDHLGVVLFNRTTRVVILTESGKKLVQVVNQSGEEVSAVLEKLNESLQVPTGKLKINAPMAFGEMFLVDAITDYAKQYPDVILDVEFDDRRVHLVEEGYDLVVRIGKLEDSGLIARKLCDSSSFICASPALLKNYGTPKNPEELKALPAVHYKNASNGLNLAYRSSGGQDGSIEIKPAIYVNSMGMLIESTLKGIGFTQLPGIFCQPYIRDGRFQSLLPNYSIYPERGVYAIYPDRRFMPIRLRLFIDLLQKHVNQAVQ